MSLLAFKDLVDISSLQILLDSLFAATGITSAILDTDAQILTASGWQDLCTKFHRVCPETEKRCKESDLYISDHLGEGDFVGYQCKNGLNDYACPIIIGGEHRATLFTGQMFHESPDMDFFRKQARLYDFEETAYLDAVNRVPIIEREKLPHILSFIRGVANLIGEMALQKKAELRSKDKDLNESNRRFDSVMSNLPGMAFQSEAAGPRKVFFASSGSFPLSGYSPEQFYGTDSFGLDSLIHPDDAGHVRVQIEEALRKNIPYSVEYRISRRSGEYKWVLERAKPVLSTEFSPRLEGLIVDISDRKNAEALYKSLFDESPDGILLIDSSDGRTVTFNCAASAQLGYTPEEFASLRIEDYEAEATLERTLERIQRILLNGRRDDFETLHRTKNGELKNISVTTQILDIDGRPLLHTIFRDVTDLKKTEEKLLSAVRELKRSNEELQRFAYVASHDLQEPLRMVASYMQLLERRYGGQMDESANEFIHFAVDGAQRMKQMINDLLAYSRLTTRGGKSDEVELEDVVSEAIQNLGFAIEESGVEISVASPLPKIYGDRAQLVQLFQNFMGNAIKFRNKDKPRVDIRACEDKGEITVAVEDNGIGIDSQYFDRIFTIFERLNNRSVYSGTGIGLAICKRIVERHGGRVWLESEIDNGSTFYFTLQKGGRENEKNDW